MLAACSTGGGGTPLSQGLSQRMDQPGASLNRAEALGIVNSYRGTVGAGALRADAESRCHGAGPGPAVRIERHLAQDAGRRGDDRRQRRLSQLRRDLLRLAQQHRPTPRSSPSRSATRAGVAAVYDANSTYGVYWVLLLDD